jgi:peptidoglycan/LPS O-acetylase OafA/YrhL
MPSQHRLPGLDTLRALAILMVLLYHYMVVVSKENTFGYITQIGWMGVDLFFVLSGYLISNQILQVIAEKKPFAVGPFYIRRLLRTLPNYYAVCLLYFFCAETLTGKTTAPWWTFLSFTQNFTFRPGDTFTHSWSLCIEEQFYLFIPLIFVLIARSRRPVFWAWLVLLLGMGIGPCLRALAYFKHGEASISSGDFYQFIYYSSFTRFDELLPGIAVAMVKNFHPQVFNYLLNRANWVFAAGVLGSGCLIYAFPHFHYQEGLGMDFLLTTLGYSALAICFALLVFAALAPTTLISKYRVPGAAQLALWSYAIYLIHKPLFKLLMAPLAQLNIDTKAPLGICIIMGLSLVAGWLLFKGVETPFMNIREKYTARLNNRSRAKLANANTISQ